MKGQELTQEQLQAQKKEFARQIDEMRKELQQTQNGQHAEYIALLEQLETTKER